jgi:hypothetical protein
MNTTTTKTDEHAKKNPEKMNATPAEAVAKRAEDTTPADADKKQT